MSFTERYTNSVNCSNLMDDQFHSRAESLMASAFADMKTSGLGSLLSRTKYADGINSRSESFATQNLAQLLRLWELEVLKKGEHRGWLPTPRTAWDTSAHRKFHSTIASMSLAFWMDGRCRECEGTGVQKDQHACPCCKGTKLAEVTGERHLVQCTKDMISDLEELFGSHKYRATIRMRQAA